MAIEELVVDGLKALDVETNQGLVQIRQAYERHCPAIYTKTQKGRPKYFIYTHGGLGTQEQQMYAKARELLKE
jgi:hypothetical protein